MIFNKELYTNLLCNFIEKSNHKEVNQLQNYIASLLKKFNITYKLIKLSKNHSMVISHFYKSSSRKTILLNGHADVVNPGKEWYNDPFKPKILNGKLFGRGSSDMKSGLCALLITYIDLYLNKNFKGNLKFISTTLEENGCLGSQKLVSKYKDFFKDVEGIIVGEPTNLFLKTKEKGAIWFKISTLGKIAHSSNPKNGENAIKKMIKLITILENKMKKIDGVTISLNKIKGGFANNIIPDFCESVLDIRIPSTANSSIIRNEIISFLKKEKALFEELIYCPSFNYDNSEKYFIQFAKSFFSKINLYDPNNTEVEYFSDGCIFSNLNIPVLIVGPGETNQAHKIDEFVYIDKYFESIVVYKNFLKAFFNVSN